MALSGTIDPTGAAGGPVLITNGSSDAIGSVHWATMPEVLEDAGVSWKVYNPPGTPLHTRVPRRARPAQRLSCPTSASTRTPLDPVPKAFLRLTRRLRQRHQVGNAARVSWIIPPVGYDEHPSSPPASASGHQPVLSALVTNPKVWSRTVLFHMYDENDGFFDHVSPPMAPEGTAGEYVTVSPLPTPPRHRRPVGMGFRVPMLVLSPFSRGGHVSSEVFDHTSQLRFLEERFGVKAPNISAWRRHTAGDLTSTLHPKRSDPTVPKLPSTSKDQTANVMALGCTQASIVEAAPATPCRCTRPGVQSMPRQETA